MQYPFCFEAIDQILQDIWSNNRFFGSLLMVIRENFAQILLIVCQGTRITIVGAYIQRFYIWSRLFLLFFQQNI